MKTEPDTFSIDDLERVGTEPWSGVRGFQARNYMRDEMKLGDAVLFYHSSCPIPGVYGLGKVASASYPDPTQFDPKSDYFDPKSKEADPTWHLVDVTFVRKLDSPYTLAQMRVNKELIEMVTLQPGSRLSITPVTEDEYREIVGTV